MGMDPSIGPGFLAAGLGYGGLSIADHIRYLRAISSRSGANFNLLHEVERINVEQQVSFLDKVRLALGELRDKKLGVLGLSFRGGTDDISEYPCHEYCARSGGRRLHHHSL